MKKYHINYANGRYLESQKYCSNLAKQVGFDEVISYRYNDIDEDFKNKNKNILSQQRGAGYWLWKPYFIHKTLEKINYGDLLVYSDSGSFYQSSVEPLIEKIKQEESGVLSFELKGLIEKEYTKKDTFILMELDNPEYTDSSQREATFIWLIKNDFTINLIKEYLNYAQNDNIITDKKSELGENYTEFKDHRHDQSIWSLLCKKYKIPAHRLISQHGLHLVNDFPNDNYGQISVHHRNPF
jgi:hypothetical protein